MAYTTQYIGSRYVPMFADPAEWNSTRTYEPLTIVLHEGNSFTSRQFVPAGTDIDNEDYWLETGNYNAQVEQYRQEVNSYKEYLANTAFAYTNVEAMKKDSSLAVGKIVTTLGFYYAGIGAGTYIITNKLDANNMDAIQLDNDLFAGLLIEEKLDITQLGAVKSTDATEMIERAAKLSNHIYIPEGDYICNNVNITKNNLMIEGASKFKTTLYNTANFAILSLLGNKNRLTHIGFRNSYPVDMIYMYNGHTRELIDCYFLNTGDVPSTKGNVILSKTDDYKGSLFLTKVADCRFDSAGLLLNSTDSYILNNEIWANGREYGLRCFAAGNTLIANNEFVSSNSYGAISFYGDSEECIRIVNNYFDGSYANIPCSTAIISSDKLRIYNMLIENNTFWKWKASCIYIPTCQGLAINGNSFFECIDGSNEIDDITLTSHSLSVSISNNLFNRKEGNGKAINFTEKPAVPCVVSGNVLQYDSIYSASSLPINAVVANNNYPNMFQTNVE